MALFIITVDTSKAQLWISHSGKVEKEQDSGRSMGSSAKENVKETTLHFRKLLEREIHLGHLLDIPNKYSH